MQVEVLADADAARQFYEARFAKGYMDRWESDRKERLAEVLAGIDLRPGSRVLDFGCGSGALTQLLAARWPDCEIHGADLSSAAIGHAGSRPQGASVRFHVLDAAFAQACAGRFHFVFSHHVLEHVHDLPGTIAGLVSLLAPGGRMLHVLPCGNPGSLPHWLCTQREDGIDPAAGNRFFFEESSHLRRLCSDELAAHFAPHGFGLRRALFGYHAWGAVRLFTELPPRELLMLLDPRQCPWQSLPRLLPLLLACVLLAAARAPAQVLTRTRRLLQQVFAFRTRRLREPASIVLLVLAVPALCLWPLAAVVEHAVRRADRREWRRRRTDPRGSEMLLEFERVATPTPAVPGPLPGAGPRSMAGVRP